MNEAAYRDLIERHVEAVLALIRGDAQIANVVFEGDVTGDPGMYVNVWHDTGFYSAHDASDTPVDVEVTFTVHSVGRDRWQAVWASGRVTARVLGVVPQIEGRRCWRIAPAGSVPVARDDDASPLRFIARDRFTLRSTPKPTT
ncbi:hypothetical protein Q9R08_05200 [Microbacterium sp. QXD-8]|uniref:SnoaL-like domain-containing protein n=1 Tax=Microbacterium psychrotolerans TaxID=3068321 RepID=A0ABU0YYG0_9MICO|nr:hypothetical protein [Microbacterium sp. QXD-8]MDQ7877370.1 hypothetical protein [Microbacterium sp. QXD-8]